MQISRPVARGKPIVVIQMKNTDYDCGNRRSRTTKDRGGEQWTKRAEK